MERGAALDISFRCDGGIITADRVRAGILCGGAHSLVHGGVDPVVAVHEGDVLALCVPKTCLPGRYQSAVFLVKTVKARVLFGIAVTEVAGAVCGAVVNENHLEVGEGLGQDTVQAADEVGFHIIYGYDDS